MRVVSRDMIVGEGTKFVMPGEEWTVLGEKKKADLAVVIAPSSNSEGTYMMLEDYCLYLLRRAGGAYTELFNISAMVALLLVANWP